MGRLFDAAAGLLGVCDNMEFEAQAAIRLERLAQDYGAVAPLADGYRLAENGVLDFHPLLAVLADCGDAARGAALFHATLTEGLAVWAGNAATEQGITGVALGGGCFLNKVLSQALQPALTAQGLNVLAPQRMAPGDSAISLGQAWIALRTLDQGV
jgi:hydrogenase maturation protein HypF